MCEFISAEIYTDYVDKMHATSKEDDIQELIISVQIRPVQILPVQRLAAVKANSSLQVLHMDRDFLFADEYVHVWHDGEQAENITHHTNTHTKMFQICS